MGNTITNVSVGKPSTSGAVSIADYGSTLPISASDTLDAAFTLLGYISDDGLTNDDSRTVSEIRAWGGDVVLTPLTQKTDKFTVTFIEALDVNVLAAVYGDDNVSGTLSTGITVRSNSDDPEPHAWVVDMIMTEGALKRIVIPNGIVTDVGSIVYKDNDPVGYKITITAKPYSAYSYDTHREFILRSAS